TCVGPATGRPPPTATSVAPVTASRGRTPIAWTTSGPRWASEHADTHRAGRDPLPARTAALRAGGRTSPGAGRGSFRVGAGRRRRGRAALRLPRARRAG